MQCDEEDLDCPYGILWAYIYFHNLTIYCQSKKDRWTMARSYITNVNSKAKLLVYNNFVIALRFGMSCMSKHGFVFQLCDVAKLAIIDKKVHPLCQMLLKK